MVGGIEEVVEKAEKMKARLRRRCRECRHLPAHLDPRDRHARSGRHARDRLTRSRFPAPTAISACCPATRRCSPRSGRSAVVSQRAEKDYVVDRVRFRGSAARPRDDPGADRRAGRGHRRAPRRSGARSGAQARLAKPGPELDFERARIALMKATGPAAGRRARTRATSRVSARVDRPRSTGHQCRLTNAGSGLSRRIPASRRTCNEDSYSARRGSRSVRRRRRHGRPRRRRGRVARSRRGDRGVRGPDRRRRCEQHAGRSPSIWRSSVDGEPPARARSGSPIGGLRAMMASSAGLARAWRRRPRRFWSATATGASSRTSATAACIALRAGALERLTQRSFVGRGAGPRRRAQPPATRASIPGATS